MPATDKIVLMFNLIFRIVGGGRVSIRIAVTDKASILHAVH